MSEPFTTQRLLDDTSVVGTAVTTSAFVPVLILGLSMMMWFAFQATQFRNEQAGLRDALAAQDKQTQESKKLRDSLESLMRGTSQLADGGNANARLIMEELKKRGITYTPGAATSTEAAAPAK